jgi:hypothetical protein
MDLFPYAVFSGAWVWETEDLREGKWWVNFESRTVYGLLGELRVEESECMRVLENRNVMNEGVSTVGNLYSQRVSGFNQLFNLSFLKRIVSSSMTTAKRDVHDNVNDLALLLGVYSASKDLDSVPISACTTLLSDIAIQLRQCESNHHLHVSLIVSFLARQYRSYSTAFHLERSSIQQSDN